MPMRGERSAAGAISAKDDDTRPFADLLDNAPEHPADGTPKPAAAKTPPRKQSDDGTDPSLAIRLPFMLPHVSPPSPLPTPDMSQAASASGVMDGVPGAAVLPTANADFAGGNVVSEKSASGTSPKVQSDTIPTPQVASRTADSAADVAGASAVSSAVAKVASSVAPGSLTQPVQAGLPVAAASAEISPSTEQAVASSVSAPVVSEPEKGILQRQSQDVSGTASAGESGGTTAAMQRVIMKDQSAERQSRTAANVAVISSAAGKQRVTGSLEKSSGTRVSESVPGIPMNAGITFEPTAGRGSVSEALVTMEPTAASEITRQTFDLIERVRVTDRDHAEVRMLLNDGQEVTVSIRLERGEWKPVFKTESEALCRALEQNWNRAVPQPGSQPVKFGTPVFESQSAQSDLGGNAQQQSESGGRERPFNRRELEPAFENVVPFPAAAKPARASHASRFSEAAAMQVYA